MYLTYTVAGYGLDSFGSQYGLVLRSCEHDYELSVYIKAGIWISVLHIITMKMG